jgi:hypothetical protein
VLRALNIFDQTSQGLRLKSWNARLYVLVPQAQHEVGDKVCLFEQCGEA